MIEGLRRQHDELMDLARELEALVRAPAPAMRRLGQLRLSMSMLLHEHIGQEEALIYAPLRTHAEAREEMVRSDENLRERQLAYSAHISAWRLDRIEPEWSQFGKDVLALTGGLAARIAYETDVIYPLFRRLHPDQEHS